MWEAAGREARRQRLELADDRDVRGLRALVAILSFVRDLRTFVERLVPAALNRAEVHEEVLPTLVGRNEAVPLLRVEPFDGSGCHLFLHLLANFVNGQEGDLHHPDSLKFSRGSVASESWNRVSNLCYEECS